MNVISLSNEYDEFKEKGTIEYVKEIDKLEKNKIVKPIRVRIKEFEELKLDIGQEEKKN